MNDWDAYVLESGQGDGDLEDVDFKPLSPKQARLNYLKFIRDVVFGRWDSRLEVVQCRKFPEFGMIQRDQIDNIIRMAERGDDFYILDRPGSLQPRKIEASKWSDDPNDLVGKEVTINLKPIGAAYMSHEQYAALAQMRADLYDAAKALHDPNVAYVQVETIGKITRDTIGHYCTAYGVEGVSTNYKEDDMNSSLDPEFLEREAARMLARAEVLRAIPQTDTFGDGQVLTFEKNFHSGVTYYYVAIKSGEWWFVTGSRAPSKVEWVSLIEFLSTEGMKTLKVVDRERSIPIADYVKGVQKVLEDK